MFPLVHFKGVLVCSPVLILFVHVILLYPVFELDLLVYIFSKMVAAIKEWFFPFPPDKMLQVGRLNSGLSGPHRAIFRPESFSAPEISYWRILFA